MAYGHLAECGVDNMARSLNTQRVVTISRRCNEREFLPAIASTADVG